jgi:hypothetical protein
MVRNRPDSYVQRMLTKTIRIAHPEMCDACADLLPAGSAVVVDASLHVTCSLCAGDDHGFPMVDPWRWIDDPALRGRLQHRHDHDYLTDLVSA